MNSFWQRVNKTDTCWLWTACTNHDGYGNFSLHRGGRHWTMRAHRVAYELIVGEIPPGSVLDHICRVRHCVNPEHVRPASNRENVLAGIGRTAINARKTHCKNGHEFTDENTYRYPTRSIRECRTCRAEANRKRRAAKAAALLNPTEGDRDER